MFNRPTLLMCLLIQAQVYDLVGLVLFQDKSPYYITSTADSFLFHVTSSLLKIPKYTEEHGILSHTVFSILNYTPKSSVFGSFCPSFSRCSLTPRPTQLCIQKIVLTGGCPVVQLSGRVLAVQARCSGFHSQQLPAFHLFLFHLETSLSVRKVGEGLVSFLTRVMSGKKGW